MKTITATARVVWVNAEPAESLRVGVSGLMGCNLSACERRCCRASGP